MQSYKIVICQCCLQRPSKSYLKESDTHLEVNKSYAEMLKESYCIELQPSDKADGICSICIKRLRDAYHFRLQVLTCQNDLGHNINFLDMGERSEIKIKHEPKGEPDTLNIDFDSHVEQNAGEDFRDEDRSDPIIFCEEIKEEVRTTRSKTRISRRKSTDPKSIAHKKAKIDDFIKSRMYVNKAESKEAKQILFMIENRLKSKKSASNPKSLVKSKIKKKAKVDININNIIKKTNCTPFFGKDLTGFLCSYCRNGFKDLAELKNHINTEHIKDEFPIDKDLTQVSVKVDITDLRCTVCDAACDNIASVTQHLIDQHKVTFHRDVANYIQEFRLPSDGVFQCTSCNSKFETFKMLLQHMNRHYKNFVCEICGTGFLNQSRYRNHKLVHSTQSFKCTYCEKTFPTMSKRNHHEKCHTGLHRKWICPHCGLELSGSALARNRHLMREHNIAAATYRCEVCNKTFLIKSCLTKHIKKHHLLEKNNLCSECDYSCFSKYSLRMHMLKHSGERVHKCEVCHKSYGRKKTLKEHMRIHVNDRRYECRVCGSKFLQKCSLKSHMQSHHSMTLEENDLINV